MEWTPTSGEQERHNVTVITVGSKYEVYVRSPASSHMQNLEQPFRTLAIKREVKILLKKSSCVFILRRFFLRLPLASSFMRPLFLRLYHASFITASVIIASVCIQYIYVYENITLIICCWGHA